MTTAVGVTGSGTFARGIHPPERKRFASDIPIELIPAAAEVSIPLLQHTGAPNEATVKTRAEVNLGDVIGKSEAFVSAPVHASINGKASKVSATTLPNGRHVSTLPIKGGDEQISAEALWEDVFGGDWTVDADALDPKEILQAVREAGVVGLGGAAFPTAVKLSPPPDKHIDTLIINGCECESYLTADYRVMLEAPQPTVAGALIAARGAGADRTVFAIEDNKPKAIQAVREAAKGTAVEVVVVKTKYPMGGEKQLIPAVLKREVPTGGLPLDVGVVVMNVGTSAAVARAVLRGKPLTHRVVTISGAGIKQPKNLLVPIGMKYRELIEYCGGLTDDAARLVSGGPMMGFALGESEAVVTKGASGLTVLTEDDVRRSAETACVRCGRCVDVCPLNLVPTKIALACRHGHWDLAKRYQMAACMECGCCAYVCPASIPLVQLIRMGKATAPRD